MTYSSYMVNFWVAMQSDHKPMHLVEFKSAFLRKIVLRGEAEINLLLSVHTKIYLQFNRV